MFSVSHKTVECDKQPSERRTDVTLSIIEYYIEQHVTNVHANHDFKAVAQQ